MMMKQIPYSSAVFSPSLLLILVALCQQLQTSLAFAVSKNASARLTPALPTKTNSSLFANRRMGKQTPGTELFPESGSSYVPSGLTPEQYAQIKKDEKKANKKDYGAWGPRFSKSERPDGDWMVVPSLWTGGFQSNAGKTAGSSVGGTSNVQVNTAPTTKRERIQQFINGTIQSSAPAYMLCFIGIECLFTAIYLLTSKKQTAASSLLAILALKIKKSTEIATLSTSLLTKITTMKAIGAITLVPFSNMLIERCNRKMLWSPRRTIGIGSMASFGLLSIWALALNVLKFR
jgi:hypothetical protein